MFKIEKVGERNRIIYKQRGMEIYSYFDTVEYIDVGGCNVEMYFKYDGYRTVAIDVRRYIFNDLKKKFPNMKKMN